MDTDLLDLGPESTADNGMLYSDVAGFIRPAVASATSTMTAHSKTNAAVEHAEPVTAPQTVPVNPQLSIPLTTSKLDPPAPHSSLVQTEHYKSPGPVNDGASSAVVVKSRPDIPPKTMSVPAIPPRKPRQPVPGQSGTSLSKSSHPQPPLPHIVPARKNTGDALTNLTYGITMPENQQAALNSVEVNGNPPLVPVPRTAAAVNLAQVQVPASSDLPEVTLDSPVPCDDPSFLEDVSKLLVVLGLLCEYKVM